MEYDEPLSNFAVFNFNVRLYNTAAGNATITINAGEMSLPNLVGWRRLPVSKPVLKAPMV